MGNPIVDLFDRTADGYQRWWAPVLAPMNVRLIDRLAVLRPELPAGVPATVLDLGCGTGSGVLEAVRRWPAAHVVALDASVGMLEVLGRELAALPERTSERVVCLRADAASLPLDDASTDVAMAAFVLQQVIDRMAVLGEMARVLRPGGLLGLAGWPDSDYVYAPEVELEAALRDAGVTRPAPPPQSGHYRSIQQAIDEVESAGFVDISAEAGTVDAPFTPEDFITYRTTTREAPLFRALAPEVRDRVVSGLARRLARLSPDDMAYRERVVLLTAVKP